MQTADIDENTRGPLLVHVPASQCRTELRVIKISFLWTIHKLDSFFCRSGCLKSSYFSARENHQLQFRLHLYHKKISYDVHDLKVIPEERTHLFNGPLKLKISIINGRGEEVKTFERWTAKYINPCPEHLKEIMFSITSNALMDSQDKLTMYCEIKIVDQMVTETRDLKKDNQILQDQTFFNDFGSFLDHQELSDAILVAEGKEFFVHKVILSGSSPVFAAMFKHEMEEKAQDRVHIADLSHEIVAEVLRFVYTGRVLRLETMAADLLVAADKYALKGLVFICEEALCKNLTDGNSAEILLLADMHNLSHLKEKVIDFILWHSEDVKETPGWGFMMKNHPHVMIEAFLFRKRSRWE